MRVSTLAAIVATAALAAFCVQCRDAGLLLEPEKPPPRVTLASLLCEMADVTSLTRLPDPPFRALRATSYNRVSVAKGREDWFADADGSGFLREETVTGAPSASGAARHEYVVMEQSGPGCLTKLWTPYFYYELNNHVGPRLRIYLDGASEPCIDAPFIEVVTQNDWPAIYGPPPPRTIPPLPFAKFTARAGNLYLPIPFAKSCKVTLDDRPFFYAIDSRAYPEGTAVESFTFERLKELTVAVDETMHALAVTPAPPESDEQPTASLAPGAPARIHLDEGGAIRELAIKLDPAEITANPALLRQLVLRCEFDGVECVWCPLGDLFASPDRLRELHTRARDSSARGELHCRFPMPFRKTADVELVNLGDAPARATVTLALGRDRWNARSLHFHATWRPDDVVAGDHFEDWNFLDVEGEGLFVGDQWTVLNRTDGWWGEGDEKIYVDASVARSFPDQFGTGTEDYYGWAGGVNPTRADVFSQPFLANVCVGSTERDSTRGFNILVRERALDAIPFTQHLVFDIEASPGVDQRGPTDRLGYSSVCFWYARPGARANRGADPAAATKPLMSFE